MPTCHGIMVPSLACRLRCRLFPHHCSAKPLLASHGGVVQGEAPRLADMGSKPPTQMRLLHAARASGVHVSGPQPDSHQGLAGWLAVTSNPPPILVSLPAPRRRLRETLGKSVREINNTSSRWSRCPNVAQPDSKPAASCREPSPLFHGLRAAP
jgi:hypothetical protein